VQVFELDSNHKEIITISVFSSEQHSSTMAADTDTSTVRIVASVETDGETINGIKQHFKKTTTWNDFQAALTSKTATHHSAIAGFPNGYSLADGKWLYNIQRGCTIHSAKLHDLTTEFQYQTMRRICDEPDTKVIIWHERIQEEAQRASIKEEHVI
jgi:hypothetical protein